MNAAFLQPCCKFLLFCFGFLLAYLYLCTKLKVTTMINRELLEPQSIVVIGGSNNVHKPGGAIVRNCHPPNWLSS